MSIENGQFNTNKPDEPDLNAIRDAAQNGELQPAMSLPEAFAQGGFHELHLRNETAHSDESPLIVPSAKRILEAASAARRAQQTDASLPSSTGHDQKLGQ